MSNTSQPQTYSTPWAAKMAAESAKADAYFGPGDTFAPHNGTDSDLNQHGADMLAEGDATWDPTSPDYIDRRGS
jgi:hypothetical protein